MVSSACIHPQSWFRNKGGRQGWSGWQGDPALSGLLLPFPAGVEVSRELPQAEYPLALAWHHFSVIWGKVNQTICCFQVNSQLALCSPTSCACTIGISSEPGTDSPCLILLLPLSHVWALMEELGDSPVSALKTPVFPSKQSLTHGRLFTELQREEAQRKAEQRSGKYWKYHRQV